MYNLIIQSFGRENEYKRALFTILSYYSYFSLSIKDTKVVLFTDKPHFFEKYVGNLPIHYVLLTPEKIKEMRGKIDFLHRMKIAVIEEAFSITNGNILYVDSDTFFIDDPLSLVQNLSEQVAFMHLLEYPFKSNVEDKTETYRNFYNLINSKSFNLANGKEIKVTSAHCSWNAGVMFFHPAHAKFIQDVYALTDQFYPSSGSHASEQYAFSIVLQENTELLSCDTVVYHYWYRVKKQIIDQFLGKEINHHWAMLSLDEKLKVVKGWTEVLPSYLDSHEWTIKDNAIQAFNANNFYKGYKWAAKAILQNPLTSGAFLKDTIYHIKRHITNK